MAAGYCEPRIERVTQHHELDVTALAEPDRLVGLSFDWTSLTEADWSAVVAEVRRITADRAVLPVPSTELIGVATR